MGRYSELATKYFKEGYNCSQALLLAFEDKIDLDKATILKLSSSFGGGMGRLREVCGAVSGMFMVVGLIDGYVEPNNDDIKCKHYQCIQDLANKFKDKYNTIICRELLNKQDEQISSTPTKRTKEFYQERPCIHFIKYAAEILEVTYKN